MNFIFILLSAQSKLIPKKDTQKRYTRSDEYVLTQGIRHNLTFYISIILKYIFSENSSKQAITFIESSLCYRNNKLYNVDFICEISYLIMKQYVLPMKKYLE